MTPRVLIRESSRRLAEAEVPDPVHDASLLLSFLCSRPSLELRLDQETVLSAGILARYETLLLRRLNREPLQYLLGSVFFCGFPFRVDSRALIPRPETEHLCTWALEFLASSSCARILDLCCGSGCIGLTLKKKAADSFLTLADLSCDALDLARENADLLDCRAEFVCSDLFSAVSGRFDLICSNPPYIPSSDCRSLQREVQAEPLMALDGGTDGLDFYRRIVKSAPDHLNPEGILLMELGFGESDAVAELLASHEYRDIQFRKDDRMINRMVAARCPDGGKNVQKA